jgi:hypothetical protein
MRYLIVLLCLVVQVAHGFEKVHYQLEKDPIDAIILCTDKDLPTLDLCIEGIRKNVQHVRRIIVVSPRQLTDQAEWFDEKDYPFTPFELAMEIFGNEEQARNFTPSGSRMGWIYQQILKLYASFVIPDISSNMLIVDADAIFLNPVSFLGPHGEGLYNPGYEYYSPYFEHMERLIPGLKRVFPIDSGISHHMLFQRSVLKDLLDTIESIHHVPAWKAICRCIDHQHLHGSSMSEYEIYFNFVFTRSDQMQVRHLKWANRTQVVHLARLQKEKYAYACCHSWYRTH